MEADKSPPDGNFWVAVQFALGGCPIVFGPFKQQEARDNRDVWRQSHPMAKISSPFHAKTKEQAELNAVYYLPTQ